MPRPTGPGVARTRGRSGARGSSGIRRRVGALAVLMALAALGAVVADAVRSQGGKSASPGDLPAECASEEPPPPLEAWPDATTAGVPTGARLTVVDGDHSTSRDGEVIRGLDITGRLQVQHDDVVVTCTRVRAMTTNEGRNLNIWLSTLGDPGGVGEGSALRWSDYTLRRVEVLGTVDGLKAEGNVDVRDSYLHDFYRTRDPSQPNGVTHNDAVQIDKGSDMLFEHNTIHAWSFSDGEAAGQNLGRSPYGDGEGYMTSAFMITAAQGDVRDVVIRDNLVRGRTSKPFILAGKRDNDVEGIEILDNLIGTENRDYPVVFAIDETVRVRGNVFLDGRAARP